MTDPEGRGLSWPKKLLFRVDGQKLTFRKEVGVLVLGLFFAGGLLATLAADDHVSVKTEETMVPDSHELSKGQVSLPSLSDVQAVGAKKVNNRALSKKPIQKDLPGLQLINRTKELLVTPGTEIPGRLESGATDGIVRVRLAKPLEVDGEVIAHEGDLLMGAGSSADDRLLVRLDRLVVGTEVSKISAVLLDVKDRMPGLRGDKVGTEAMKLATAVGLSFAGGYADGLKEKKVEQGVEVTENSRRNALLHGASLAALEHSKNLMSEVQDAQSRIEVPADTQCLVLFL